MPGGWCLAERVLASKGPRRGTAAAAYSLFPSLFSRRLVLQLVPESGDFVALRFPIPEPNRGNAI